MDLRLRVLDKSVHKTPLWASENGGRDRGDPVFFVARSFVFLFLVYTGILIFEQFKVISIFSNYLLNFHYLKSILTSCMPIYH